MPIKIIEVQQTLRDGIAMLPEMVDIASELPNSRSARSAGNSTGLPSRESGPLEVSDRHSASAERFMGETAEVEPNAKVDRRAALRTPTGLSMEAVRDIPAAGAALLADIFALYMKTKNFHWHMSGAHFRDYHVLLDDHGNELFSMTDPLAERLRKLGGSALRSIGDITKRQRIQDNDAEFVHPHEMLAELRDDNGALLASLRSFHALCDAHGDVATASLLENWIEDGEKRVWYLFEITRDTSR